MFIQYKRTTTEEPLINTGINAEGVVTCGQWNQSGSPSTTAGVYAPSAFIQNIVDSTLYFNSGTTASPSWSIIESSDLLQSAQITLSREDILQLNTTPKVMVPALGDDVAIMVVRGLVQWQHNGTPYETESVLDIQNPSSDVKHATVTSVLNATVSKNQIFTVVGGASTNQTQVVFGEPLIIKAQRFDPTAGDGTAIINFVYYTVTK